MIVKAVPSRSVELVTSDSQSEFSTVYINSGTDSSDMFLELNCVITADKIKIFLIVYAT